MTSSSVSVIFSEDENTDAPEAPVVTDSPAEKPSQSGTAKKIVPGRPGSLKDKTKANGTAGKKKVNIEPKSKQNSATGPKKAKFAKKDGETVKGEKTKNTAVKTADESKATKDQKKDGSRFEKTQGMKRKTSMMAKTRMGKNKFKKLTKMLEKQNTN